MAVLIILGQKVTPVQFEYLCDACHNVFLYDLFEVIKTGNLPIFCPVCGEKFDG